MLSTIQVIELGYKRQKTVRLRKVMEEERITKRKRRWSQCEDVLPGWLSCGWTISDSV